MYWSEYFNRSRHPLCLVRYYYITRFTLHWKIVPLMWKRIRACVATHGNVDNNWNAWVGPLCRSETVIAKFRPDVPLFLEKKIQVFFPYCQQETQSNSSSNNKSLDFSTKNADNAQTMNVLNPTLNLPQGDPTKLPRFPTYSVSHIACSPSLPCCLLGYEAQVDVAGQVVFNGDQLEDLLTLGRGGRKRNDELPREPPENGRIDVSRTIRCTENDHGVATICQ